MSVLRLTDRQINKLKLRKPFSEIGDVKAWRKFERERHLKQAVIPLSSARPRSLTLPLYEEQQQLQEGSVTEPSADANAITSNRTRKALQQRTSEQKKSLLFVLLPPEIRYRIYELAIGGKVLKVLKDSRSQYVTWLPQEEPLLSLPKTCRRIYSETISLLYSHNTFLFEELDTILWFASTVLPRRVSAIRSMRIECDCICFWKFPQQSQPPPPFDSRSWFRVWDTISNSFHGLRHLTVSIWNGPKMDAQTETEVFAPLYEIRGLKHFELELPWQYRQGNSRSDRQQQLGIYTGERSSDDGGDDQEGHRDAPFVVKRVHRRWDPTPF